MLLKYEEENINSFAFICSLSITYSSSAFDAWRIRLGNESRKENIIILYDTTSFKFVFG